MTHALPSSEALPETHDAQVLPLYSVPGEHGVHATAPGSLKPEVQSSHASEAPRENVLATHCASPTRRPFKSIVVAWPDLLVVQYEARVFE